MKPIGDLRAFSTFVERISTRESPRSAIHRLSLIRRQVAVCEKQLIDLMTAQLLIILGDHTAATATADRAEAMIASLDGTARPVMHLKASLLITRGLLGMMTEPEKSIDQFQQARDLYEVAEEPWKMGAAECNLAISLGQMGRATEALEHLESAELYSRSAAPDPELLASRLRNIEVNRAIFCSLLQQGDDYLATTIATRTAAVEAEDHGNIGRIDHGLASHYQSKQQFGSALRAATSAQHAFEAAGLTANAIAAEILAAKALIELGRYDGVGDFLTKTIADGGDDIGRRPLWWDDALEAFALFHRRTNPELGAGIRTDLSGLIARTPALDAMAHLQSMLDDAIDRIARGKFGPPPPEMAIYVERIRGFGIPDAVAITDVVELMLIAVSAGEDLPRLSAEQENACIRFGMTAESLHDVVRGARLVHTYDERKHFEIALGEIADHQVLLTRQESEFDRSNLLDSAAGSLGQALKLSLALDESEITFELLEAGRRDLSEWSSGLESLKVIPFSEIVTASEQAGFPRETLRTDVIRTPTLMSVNGRSALASVRTRRQIGGDASTIRRGLGGPDAAWLSMRVVGHDLVWAWLEHERVTTGSQPIGEPFLTAWEAHSYALPIATRKHAEIAGSEAPAWAVELLATGIAAAGPLVARPELAAECLDALPRAIAKRAATAINRQAGLEQVYRDIGTTVLPKPLREWLDRGDGENRLLVSVPAELSSLPFPILELGDADWLGERTVALLTPPSNLASIIAGRPHSSSLLESFLTVSDPTDDLTNARITNTSMNSLAGWSRASEEDHVASLSNVLRSFRDLGATGSYGFSYVGHIRAGTKSNPGLSALVLSPPIPQNDPVLLDARDLHRGSFIAPRDVYLGGCESTGFGTGLEWASIAGAFLTAGTDLVLAHAWPILDTINATQVDEGLIEMLESSCFSASKLLDVQRQWIKDWRLHPTKAIPPHHWAGLNLVGRLL